jgi:tetratricopeptide (TPR) repeat protein
MADGRTSGLADEPPRASEIRAALSRISASDPFRSAPQLVSFLTFVVEKTIAGESGELKGYTIATRALGRPPEFDPQIDPIVRVEAMRLRRALQAYYSGAGADDPLVMSIPRGSYVPQFCNRGETVGLPLPLEGSPTDWTPECVPVTSVPRTVRPRAALAAAVLSGILIGVIGVMLLSPAPQKVAGAPLDMIFPVVAVQAVTTEEGSDIDPRTLRTAMIETLVPFDEIDVMEGASGPPGDLSFRLDLRALSKGGAAAVAANLVHVASGEVVWSRSIPVPPSDESVQGREAALAKIVALRVVPPFGVLGSFQRGRPAANPRAACISSVYAYWFAGTPAKHEAARTCLEAEFRVGRPNHLALAYLAYIYLDEQRSGYNPRPGSLDRALEVALRAVELGPESARAHQVLMNVRFGLGDINAAIDTGRRALRLNPIDPDFKANFGARLIETGHYREGVELLVEAEASVATVPAWRNTFAFFGYLMLGEDERAGAAAERTRPDQPLGLIARVIAASRRGRTEDAAAYLERLQASHPDAYRNPAALLVRRRFNGALVTRIMSELAIAGLDGVVSGALPEETAKN